MLHVYVGFVSFTLKLSHYKYKTNNIKPTGERRKTNQKSKLP